MKVSYYPGCSLLQGTGKEYGDSIRTVFKALGIELIELNDWNCCGASSGHSAGKKLAVGLAARNLIIAEKSLLKELVIPCSACFNRSKSAEYELKNHPEYFPEIKYNGDVKITDIVTFIHKNIGFNKLRKIIKKELTGLKAVCYYGCLTLRHPRITDAKNYEDPTAMDEIIKSLGIDVIDWSYKIDCCGGSLSLSKKEIAWNMVNNLLIKALEAGAECIAVCCPLCHANLDIYQKEISRKFNKNYKIPIVYFTELIGLALEEKDAKKWLQKHFTDSVTLFSAKNLI